MIITVIVKPNAKRAFVEEIGAGEYVVSVGESPRDGKANAAVIKAIAAHLHIAPWRLEIKSGATGKKKLIEIYQ